MFNSYCHAAESKTEIHHTLVFSPTPDVYWERLDDVLPDRHSFKSFGQELQISDVRESDSGLYECLGLNTESQQRATKAFTVTIRSMPLPFSLSYDIDYKKIIMFAYLSKLLYNSGSPIETPTRCYLCFSSAYSG